MSRRERVSYHPAMNRIPGYLEQYFAGYSYVLLYPVQAGATREPLSVGKHLDAAAGTTVWGRPRAAPFIIRPIVRIFARTELRAPDGRRPARADEACGPAGEVRSRKTQKGT